MKAKNICVVLLALLVFAASILPATSSQAAEIEVTGDAYVTVNSGYVWRGTDYTGDADFVIQTGADLSAKGFTLSWWGNTNGDNMEMDEVDLVLDYSTDLNEMVSLSVGNILYQVPGPTEYTTNEAYLGLGFGVLLDPAVTLYYMYDTPSDADKTSYLDASIGYGMDLNEKTSVSAGLLVGMYDFDFLNNLEVSIAADYAVSDQISISPAVLFSTPMSDDAEDAGIDDEFVGGVTVTLAF
ncbi:MAG: hypothetical protein C0618_08255 [Desulfuromonas sp.]|nr:MAG: hypothetical protein C0618_08255 [Desulfuromonas sp.]